MDPVWTDEYLACPIWGVVWAQAHTTGAPWPPHIQLHREKMYFEDRLCIPCRLSGLVIRAHHASVGHVGADRLWYEIERWYAWAVPDDAKRLAKYVNH